MNAPLPMAVGSDGFHSSAAACLRLVERWAPFFMKMGGPLPPGRARARSYPVKPAEAAEMVRLAWAKVPQCEIARRMKRSETIVSRYVRAAGVPTPTRAELNERQWATRKRNQAARSAAGK